jgi:hypothetical protein
VGEDVGADLRCHESALTSVRWKHFPLSTRARSSFCRTAARRIPLCAAIMYWICRGDRTARGSTGRRAATPHANASLRKLRDNEAIFVATAPSLIAR